MSAAEYGISLTAKPIIATPWTFIGETTHRLAMGAGNVSIHINPEIARQWIGVLQTITAEEK